MPLYTYSVSPSVPWTNNTSPANPDSAHGANPSLKITWPPRTMAIDAPATLSLVSSARADCSKALKSGVGCAGRGSEIGKAVCES